MYYTIFNTYYTCTSCIYISIQANLIFNIEHVLFNEYRMIIDFFFLARWIIDDFI